MPPRLLSLLSLIEGSLNNNGAAIGAAPAQRTVNFNKGTASMEFSSGAGTVLLQSYSLADGQLCVRASFGWRGSAARGSHLIYPSSDFNWAGAAEQIAMGWMDGVPEVEETPASQEQVSATG